MTTTAQMHIRFKAIWSHLDEKGRRLWAASEAKAFGRGGLKIVHEVTGMSRSVTSEGIRELTGERLLPEGRVRRVGAGRKLLEATDESLLEDLKTLVESSTMGDPGSPLLWTTQSLRSLTGHLKAKGHKIGHVTVGALLANKTKKYTIDQ